MQDQEFSLRIFVLPPTACCVWNLSLQIGGYSLLSTSLAVPTSTNKPLASRQSITADCTCPRFASDPKATGKRRRWQIDSPIFWFKLIYIYVRVCVCARGRLMCGRLKSLARKLPLRPIDNLPAPAAYVATAAAAASKLLVPNFSPLLSSLLILQARSKREASSEKIRPSLVRMRNQLRAQQLASWTFALGHHKSTLSHSIVPEWILLLQHSYSKDVNPKQKGDRDGMPVRLN